MLYIYLKIAGTLYLATHFTRLYKKNDKSISLYFQWLDIPRNDFVFALISANLNLKEEHVFLKIFLMANIYSLIHLNMSIWRNVLFLSLQHKRLTTLLWRSNQGSNRFLSFICECAVLVIKFVSILFHLFYLLFEFCKVCVNLQEYYFHGYIVRYYNN